MKIIRRKTKMELTKLSGIYSIQNKLNHKQYIGHSKNITFRWYYHLNNLLENKHPNSKLQEDFNTYGLSVFNFSILELIEGKDNLMTKEQEYLNKLDFDNNYNLYNSIKEEKEADVDEFMNYIKSRWLVKDINNTELYRIHKQEDKKEIINKAIKCNIINMQKSKITFNKVMNYISDNLNFKIITKRSRIKGVQYRYKLIVDFDEDYMEEVVNGN